MKVKLSTIAWVFILFIIGVTVAEAGGGIIAVILYFLLRDKIAVAWDRYFGKPGTD